MGQLSKELFPPNPTLMRELLRAYCDEWFGHYNYLLVSHLVKGPSSASVAALLRGKSEACLSRAERLILRLLELGQDSIPKLTELIDHATAKPFKLPESSEDIGALLVAVLDAERTSIRTFARIRELAREDPITEALAVVLLTEAMRGEQEMETLLGSSAPSFQGT